MEECREQDKRTGQLSGSSRPERMVRIKAKKRNPRLRGGEDEGDIRMASWRTANEMIDIISKCM
jgi:hypothetical protein